MQLQFGDKSDVLNIYMLIADKSTSGILICKLQVGGLSFKKMVSAQVWHAFRCFGGNVNLRISKNVKQRFSLFASLVTFTFFFIS